MERAGLYDAQGGQGMKVCTLITIPSPEAFNNCTLILKSLKIGFPNAKLHVYLNKINQQECQGNVIHMLQEGMVFHLLQFPIHHADWIQSMIDETDGELIIVDPDVTFWKEFKMPTYDMLAGHFVPIMWNEWAQCISQPRLHTELLCIKDCQVLLGAIVEKYPMAVKSPQYAPLNPFLPSVKFSMGRPIFYDTCSVLYNMLGGTNFTEEQFECYDHVNSSSFVKLMSENMEHGEEFKQHHERISRMPELLKGFWRQVEQYYQNMHNKAVTLLQTN
jgi:hypothetical protein